MKKIFFSALALIAVYVTACKKEESTNTTNNSAQLTEVKKQVVNQYATIVYKTYVDALQAATEYKSLVDAFVAAPTADGFTLLKDQYATHLRPSYGQSDVFRFYGGPIDDDQTGPEGMLNSWPMDEGYIDYVKNVPNSGIINNTATYPTIDKNMLASLNQATGETNISTGYHAIEFLLWGQDFYADSPGKRAYTDYVKGAGGTALNQDRRGQYLKAVISLIVDDLQTLVDAWNPASTSNYYHTFTTQNTDSSVTKILTGMGKFTKGELFGERMSTAYTTQDQEDEHSCFSDQTHNDFKFGIKGILNVYYGRYTTTDGQLLDGAGIEDLLKIANNNLNNDMQAKLSAAEEAINNIPPPFDQAILGVNVAQRAKVKAAIDSGNTLASKIAESAKAIGINITL